MIDCLAFMERNGKRIFYTKPDAEYQTKSKHIYNARTEDFLTVRNNSGHINKIARHVYKNRRKAKHQ